MKRFFVLLLISLFFSVAYCQQEPEKCPFGGREDCTGYCGLFTDENEDGFCDYSILTNQKNEQEEKKEETKTEKNDSTLSPTMETKSVKTIEQNHKTILKDGIVAESSDTKTKPLTNTLVKQTAEKEQIKPVTKNHSPYHFWLLFCVTMGLYICSVILVKQRVIRKVTHRKIWNFILLISCLVSCLLGVYIILAKMYGWAMNYMTVLKLHVDFGIVMTIVAIIHILWHLKYFKSLFKSNK